MAAVIGLLTYGLLCAFLIYAVWRVYGAPYWPAWAVKFYRWKMNTNVKGYFTVRYETDDAGLWQIIEETATGNRYRLHVRDSEGRVQW